MNCEWYVAEEKHPEFARLDARYAAGLCAPGIDIDAFEAAHGRLPQRGEVPASWFEPKEHERPQDRPRSEIIGERHGTRVIIADLGYRSGSRLVRTRCDCGSEKIVGLWQLRKGYKANCAACRSRAQMAARRTQYVGATIHTYRVLEELPPRSSHRTMRVVCTACGATTAKELREMKKRPCACQRQWVRAAGRAKAEGSRWRVA